MNWLWFGWFAGKTLFFFPAGLSQTFSKKTNKKKDLDGPRQEENSIWEMSTERDEKVPSWDQAEQDELISGDKHTAQGYSLNCKLPWASCFYSECHRSRVIGRQS